jgi:hypothetical protein
MTKPAFLVAILLVYVFSSGAQMKDVYIPGIPPPPAPLDPDHGKTTPDQPKMQRRVDPVKLQKDADNLALTAQSIPSDVVSIRKGMLPKDTIQKLKEIEKLSKRLRSELSP